MKHLDLNVLNELSIILERNCRYCGEKFIVNHKSSKYCNAQCRANFHNSIRKYPQLIALADAEIPLNLDWIKRTVTKIITLYEGERFANLVNHKCDECHCLDFLAEELDYDLCYLLCGTCFTNWLLLLMKYDLRTKALILEFPKFQNNYS